MGVLNVTPDSFFDGGQLHSSGQLVLDKVLARVEQMLAEGAAIIDVGGESTRPGAATVSLQEEMDRVLPVVTAIAQRFDTVVSVDTSSPEVMLASAAAGAGLLNDIRALQRPGAIKAAAATGLPVCLMHMQGEPGSMQDEPVYENVVSEVKAFLERRAEDCVHAGIARRNILLDPGFGFGKTDPHNLALLNQLSTVVAAGYPVLVGLSRKSMIGRVLGRPVEQRLAASLALATLGVRHGAKIVRAHDVIATVDAVRLCDMVMKENNND
jgi:dihydropteroate synthase